MVGWWIGRMNRLLEQQLRLLTLTVVLSVLLLPCDLIYYLCKHTMNQGQNGGTLSSTYATQQQGHGSHQTNEQAHEPNASQQPTLQSLEKQVHDMQQQIEQLKATKANRNDEQKHENG